MALALSGTIDQPFGPAKYKWDRWGGGQEEIDKFSMALDVARDLAKELDVLIRQGVTKFEIPLPLSEGGVERTGAGGTGL